MREITHYRPYFVFLCLSSLLFLGWGSLGVLVLLGILAFKSARWGFSIGLAINLAGLIIHRSGMSGVWTYISIGNHLMLAYHSFGDSTSHYPALILSYAYWGSGSSSDSLQACIWLAIRILFGGPEWLAECSAPFSGICSQSCVCDMSFLLWRSSCSWVSLAPVKRARGRFWTLDWIEPQCGMLFLWLLPVQGCETPRWSECSDGFFPT